MPYEDILGEIDLEVLKAADSLPGLLDSVERESKSNDAG